MTQKLQLTGSIADSSFGQRLDQALADLFPDYSRSRIKEWILDGRVLVNGSVMTRPREKMLGGESIQIDAEINLVLHNQPEAIPLNIVYEDDAILVLNKPRGLVVHPGAGNTQGTLLNALLYHYPQLAEVPRAGIIHRLDKDTTGLMVVAKNVIAQLKLVELLQERKMTREYEAVVNGIMTAGGKVDAPMARHPTQRTHMAVFPLGKPAVTHYRVFERFGQHTRLRLRLETGRTHQIRVHMAHINHPLIGDPLYAGRFRLPKGASPELIETLRGFNRQALHAIRLMLPHPITGEPMQWEAPLPDDMVQLIQQLKQHHALHRDDD